MTCADKLDNITSKLTDYRQLGELLWERFNAGRQEQQWYYTAIAEAFAQRVTGADDPLTRLSDQLSATVKETFG